MRRLFLIPFLGIFLLAGVGLSFSPAIAQAMTLTPTVTPTGLSTLPVNTACPTGMPSGYGTLTPSALWLNYCSHCLPQNYTETPGPTFTPQPTNTLAPNETPQPTVTPGLTTSPTPSGSDWVFLTDIPGEEINSSRVVLSDKEAMVIISSHENTGSYHIPQPQFYLHYNGSQMPPPDITLYVDYSASWGFTEGTNPYGANYTTFLLRGAGDPVQIYSCGAQACNFQNVITRTIDPGVSYDLSFGLTMDANVDNWVASRNGGGSFHFYIDSMSVSPTPTPGAPGYCSSIGDGNSGFGWTIFNPIGEPNCDFGWQELEITDDFSIPGMPLCLQPVEVGVITLFGYQVELLLVIVLMAGIGFVYNWLRTI